jgi:GGDEF domain-containing protein
MTTLHSTRTTEELLALIRQQQARIVALTWNDELAMLNQAGLRDAVASLPDASYTVVLCDIDRLKTINSATGSHMQTNRYLRDGLRVRRGEIAGQLYGDEFLFVLEDGADVTAFQARIGRQLAQQPLGQAERAMLESVAGPGARLSATFASAAGVTDVWAAVEQLSIDVLAQKARRDGRRA